MTVTGGSAARDVLHHCHLNDKPECVNAGLLWCSVTAPWTRCSGWVRWRGRGLNNFTPTCTIHSTHRWSAAWPDLVTARPDLVTRSRAEHIHAYLHHSFNPQMIGSLTWPSYEVEGWTTSRLPAPFIQRTDDWQPDLTRACSGCFIGGQDWRVENQHRPSQGRERGGVLGEGQQAPSPPARGSMGALWAPPAGRRWSPNHAKVFHYFQHSRWPPDTVILLNVDYHAAIGAQEPCPPPSFRL